MYQRVVVTVKRKDEARVRDLEVPVNISAERLAEMIARALRWETDPAGQRITYLIEAHPLGRMLQPDETLAGAGVWDGSWLVLHAMQPPSAEGSAPSASPSAQPVMEGPPPAQRQPAALTPAPITPAPPVNQPQDDAWNFPVAPAVPPPGPQEAAQPEPAQSDSLLEMLLSGSAEPAQDHVPQTAPLSEPQPPQAQGWQPQPVEPPPPTYEAAPAPPPPPPVQPQQASQAQQQPEQAPPVTWDFPVASGPLTPLPEVEPQPPAHETAPQPGAESPGWDFATPQANTFTTGPLEPLPETAQPEQPAQADSLLEMLLGGTPATPAPPETEQPAAPVQPEPSQPQGWNFPVAQQPQPPVSQPEMPAPTRPAPLDAWAFPVAPEPAPPDEPEPTAQTADQSQQGNSLLEMLLGGTSTTPDQAAPAPPPEQAPPTFRPTFEGQPPVVAPPEPQPQQWQPEPAQTAPAQQPAQPQEEPPGPAPSGEPKVGGFRPLGIDLPPATEAPPDDKKPRFVWKKLDD